MTAPEMEERAFRLAQDVKDSARADIHGDICRLALNELEQ